LNLGIMNSYRKKYIYTFIGSTFPTIYGRSENNELILKKLSPEERMEEEELVKKEK